MAKIQQRATTQYGISTSNKKKTRDSTDTQRSRPDPQLDPSELQLIPNTFVGEDGIPVEHLHINSVRKGKTGIAFATIHQAMPYLQGAEQLSAGPLAILTTTPAPSISTLVAEDLMYPAMHANTLEPLLIHGSLIQLGKVLITRPALRQPPNMAPISTNTIKLAVYQDLWQGDWQVFIEGPMKQVMLAFPILTLCKTPGCGNSCQKFHPPVDEDHLDNVILDIWGRQWASPSGARVNKDKVACWTALIRAPEVITPNLLALSGTGSSSTHATNPAKQRTSATGSSGCQEPHFKLHTTNTAPPRDPSRSSGSMTATACGLTLHNYPRHTSHSSTWHSAPGPHQVTRILGMARKTTSTMQGRPQRREIGQHALPQLVLHPGATSTIEACQTHGLPCIWVLALSRGSRSLAAPSGPHRTPSTTIQPASRLCGRHRKGLQPPSTRPHQANCQTRWLRHGLCRSLATGFARRFKVHDILGAPLFSNSQKAAHSAAWQWPSPTGATTSTNDTSHLGQPPSHSLTTSSWSASHSGPGNLPGHVPATNRLRQNIPMWSPGCPPEAAEPHRIPGQPEGQGFGWTNDLQPTPQNCPPHQHCSPTPGTWSLLRRLRAPARCKTYVLAQAIWPKVFHSAPIEDLSNQLIKQAVKVLGHGNAGANPAIRLSLLTTNILNDPGFYQLWQIIRTFRRLLHKQPTLLKHLTTVSSLPDRSPS